MEVMLIFLCILGGANLLLLIGIAGSLAKMIKYMRGDEDVMDEVAITTNRSNLPSGPLYRMENGELVEIGGPTYDTDVFRGSADPFADGVRNRPTSQNWDGVPVSKEE